jgi:GMP synthase-like glutamine amidotransferase
MKTITIVQHTTDDPPGGIVTALDALGLPYRVVRIMAGEEIPASTRDLSALVLLGGAMHVHQEEEHPFLGDERRLLTACLEQDVPVLGICLGAQVLAAAAGAPVYQRPLPEIGWVDVDIVAADPLFQGIESPLRVLQWHKQSFALPPGALRIASRPDGEQAFRVGRRAWGIQFHPEVGAAVIEAWIREAEAGDREGLLPGMGAAIREETKARMPAYERLCLKLVENFVRATGLEARTSPFA